MGMILLGTGSRVLPTGTILRNVGQTTAGTASSLVIRGGLIAGSIESIDAGSGTVNLSTGAQAIPYASGTVFFDTANNGFKTSTAASSEIPTLVTLPSDGGREYFIGESVESISAVSVNGATVTGTVVTGNDRNFITLAADATAGNVLVTYIPTFNKTVQITIATAGLSIGDQVYQFTGAGTTLHTHTATSAVASYPIQLAYDEEQHDVILLNGTNVAQIFI